MSRNGPSAAGSMVVAWDDHVMSVLSLGTAQWGSDYGITNAVGRISNEECARIIDVAIDAGIHSVDTALSYGDAQQRLRPWATRFAMTTKVSGQAVVEQTNDCLLALGVDPVDAVLVHDWDALDERGRRSAVVNLGVVQSQGLVTRVGVSVYDEGGLSSAHDIFAACDVQLGAIQVPANALDRRLDHLGVLHEVVRQGARVQLRSAFLQGLLAGATLTALGRHEDVRAFHTRVVAEGSSPIDVALGHVKSLPWVDEVVIGVTSAAELREICEAWERVEPIRAPEDLGSMDLDLIDPRRW